MPYSISTLLTRNVHNVFLTSQILSTAELGSSPARATIPRTRRPNQNSNRRASCPVRLPAFSAVCCAFNTPNVLGLLILVAGGA
jgi:hypothetical protein